MPNGAADRKNRASLTFASHCPTCAAVIPNPCAIVHIAKLIVRNRQGYFPMPRDLWKAFLQARIATRPRANWMNSDADVRGRVAF
jgi:hypothetical protein